MQYPTIAQPQYGFAPTMPGMASGGLASLPVRRFQDGGVSTAPRYSYNPVTQSYTLLTPEQQANLAMAAQRDNYGGGFEVGPNPFSQMTPAEQAAYYAENPTMGAVTQLGQQAFGMTSLGMAQKAIDPIGVAQAQTIAQGINPTLATPLGVPGVVTVSPIAPDPTVALTAINEAQKAEEETQVSPVDVATTVAATQDAVDAEGGQTVGVGTPSGVGTDTGAGGGGGGMGPNDGPSPSGNGSGGGPSDGGDGTGDGRRRGGFIMNYEQGGLAAAQQTQSKGRGQDTMLVHMTPKEVGGLQALAMAHGGSLTINPQTGLPEAGFLSAILPMVAGFALGPAGFGLMSSALGAGAVVGGLTGLATGSLKKGLMAGLGAYGGFGLGQGLVSAATPAEAAMTPIPGGAPATPTGAFSAANIPPTAPPVISPSSALTPDAFNMGNISGSGGDFLGNATSNMTDYVGGGSYPGSEVLRTAPPQTNLLTPTSSSPTGIKPAGTFSASNIPPPAQPTGFGAATEGLGNVFKPAADGGAVARAKFGAALPYGTTIAAAAPIAAEAAKPPPGPTPSKSFIRGYDLDITNPSGTPQYTPQDTREREQVRYAYSPRPVYEAAQGGLAALNGQTYDDEYGRDEYKAGGQAKARSKSLRGDPYYKFADSRKDSSMEAAIEQNFAKGGMKDALPPRFLSGGGDGMSDSIKARIGGVQEARLADGEFVVPADVVSHLGNGSSKAGAKKLYAMMDKIRKARTGRTRQAPEVNARRYMPA